MLVRRKDGTTIDLDVEHWLRTKEWRPVSRGLGDTVANAIKKVSRGKITPCGGCQKRRELLNKLVPYKEQDHG